MGFALHFVTVNPMLPRTIAIAASTLIAVAVTAQSAVIVNLDFNGQRTGDPAPPTYVGTGAVGTGTVFNGIVANDTASGDNITVTGTNLQDQFGNATTIGVSFSPVGGDLNGGGGNALGIDYIFVNSANNHAPAPFTVSGLGGASTVDLYFYHFNNVLGTTNLSISIPGETSDSFTGTGIFTNANTLYFANVPVSAGKVNGTFGTGSTASLLMGMTVVVPEPSTVLLCGVAMGVILLFRRRKLTAQ